MNPRYPPSKRMPGRWTKAVDGQRASSSRRSPSVNVVGLVWKPFSGRDVISRQDSAHVSSRLSLCCRKVEANFLEFPQSGAVARAAFFRN